ncbi:MAG: metallophosphoesterase [Akkermansiaceae bacterium]|nr:metallophosphoesterase [Armatimonadota bacterium]
MSNIRKIAWVAGSGSLFAGLVYWWAQFVEPYWLEQTTPEIFCPRLPSELDGLRILFLADTHVQTWTRREDRLLELLKHDLRQRPDIIVWGGDFLYYFGDTEKSLRLVTAVHDIFPDVPTFGILGNAEHKGTRQETARFVQRLEAAGVRMLNNASDGLTLRGVPITIAGVDDPYYGFDDLCMALRDVPDDRFTILLAHSPQIVYRAAKAGVDLMLSGHTHGGQVRLPFLGALKAQNPLGTKLDQGLFERDRLRPILAGRDVPACFRLYITRGIGVAPTWRLFWLRPRLLCRPEVTFLSLHCPPD